MLPIDGIPGAQVRARSARRHLDEFGVAMYCGFGRRPGQDPAATLRGHQETALALRR